MNKKLIECLKANNIHFIECERWNDIYGYEKLKMKEDTINYIEVLEYENDKLKRALKEIREYVYQHEYCRFGHIDGGEADEIYKIIDKVLGDDER